MVLIGKLHGGGCVIQRSEQILFHVSDRAAVLCKALQHKADMVGVQLHKATAYHLGGLIVPGNTQRLAVGGAGVHQQIYDLIDGVLIIREKPEQQFEKRAVKVGLSDGIKIEIKEGLAENEKVRGAIVDPNKK